MRMRESIGPTSPLSVAAGWLELRKVAPISPDVDYSSIIVTTADVVRYSYLLELQVANHIPILFVGPTGTGKSVYIKSFLSSKLDRTKWMHMVFNFSAQTSANMTQVRGWASRYR
jgi:dynein heavy chain